MARQREKEEKSKRLTDKQLQELGIDGIIAFYNKKGKAVIQRGKDIRWEDPQRIPSGSLTLDYITGGGIPRGRLTQFKGKESSGKTTTACKVVGNVMRSGGEVAWAAAEGFDKKWARKTGAPIPYNEAELAKMNKLQRKFIEKQEWPGSFTLISADTGDSLLDVVIDFTRSGQFDLIVIDSLAMLRSTRIMNDSVEKENRGGQGKMFSEWTAKMYPAFNNQESMGNPKTAIIGINQLRDQGFQSQFQMAPDSPGGWALKHGKGLDVQFTPEDLIIEAFTDYRVVYGRTTQIKVTKSKVCPPFREGTFDFYFEDYMGHKAGEIDLAKEIRVLGTRLGLIKQGGSWFSIGGKKLHGGEKFDSYLRANPKVMNALEEGIRELAKPN